jgi:hypothetical protein
MEDISKEINSIRMDSFPIETLKTNGRVKLIRNGKEAYT